MNATWSPALAGSIGSLLAGLATAVGALPVLGISRSAQRYQGVMLGFAAGVMLAASFFSLIVPALADLKAQGAGPWRAALVAAGSVAAGAAVIMALGRVVRQENEDGALSCDGLSTNAFSTGVLSERSLWLFVMAITLHNIPEGMAVGVSFANGAYTQGTATAIGIGVQNIPEGFAVGCALALRYSAPVAFLGALISGLVEPAAGAVGALLVAQFQLLLPWALCLAAGAMISVIMSQITPNLGHDPAGRPQIALILGLSMMMVLDVALS